MAFAGSNPASALKKLLFNNHLAVYRLTALRRNIMTEVIVNDAHVPFHDKVVFRLFINFIKKLQPKTLYIAGDWADCYSISRFDKDPSRVLAFSLINEANEVYNTLVDIRNAVPNTRIIYIDGNHEKRLIKYLWKHPELTGFTCIEKLFNLKEVGIQHEESGVWSGKFYITHGSVVRKHAGYTAKAEQEKNGCSGISGHTHRDGKYTIRNRSGHFVWFENYCLCDLDAEYIDGIANWTHGWSILHTIKNRQYVEQIPVINHRYIYNGKEYK